MSRDALFPSNTEQDIQETGLRKAVQELTNKKLGPLAEKFTLESLSGIEGSEVRFDELKDILTGALRHIAPHIQPSELKRKLAPLQNAIIHLEKELEKLDLRNYEIIPLDTKISEAAKEKHLRQMINQAAEHITKEDGGYEDYPPQPVGGITYYGGDIRVQNFKDRELNWLSRSINKALEMLDEEEFSSTKNKIALSVSFANAYHKFTCKPVYFSKISSQGQINYGEKGDVIKGETIPFISVCFAALGIKATPKKIYEYLIEAEKAYKKEDSFNPIPEWLIED